MRSRSVAGYRLGSVEIALVGAVALAGIAVARSHALWRDRFQVVCPAWAVLGVPCPTCGATRAVVAVMQGELSVALAWNPLAALLGVGAVISVPFVALVLGGRMTAPRVPTSLGTVSRTAIIAVFVANWLYLLRYFGG